VAAALAACVVTVSTAACQGDSPPEPGRAKPTANPTAKNVRATPDYPTTGPAPHTAPQDERPNIVLISADDMRADELRYLPRTRRLLGRAGLSLTQALTPHPLCCPARAELLTGQYAQNNGVRTNFPPQGGFVALDRAHTIGSWLNAAGYNTSMVGKHLNAANFKRDGRDPGWTLFDPTQFGYSDYYDFLQYNNGDPVRVKDRYYTDYVGAQSASYAHQLSTYDAPFFMWVSHFGPHSTQAHNCQETSACEGKTPPRLSPTYEADTAQVARDRALARTRTAKLMTSAAVRERDLSDKQKYVTAEPAPTRTEVQQLVRGRIGALRSVDDAIAGLLDQLRADGELDHTYVVFITDNGYLIGEHGYVGKVLGYEPALRTPMLVRGPGIEPGATSDEVVTLVDLASTFVDIAGAEPDLTLDGVSLRRLWQGAEVHPHRGGVLILAGALKSETGRTGWYYRGIRTERYTYLRYHDGWVELYDRRRDPQQVRSVADDPRYARVERELERRLVALQDCNGPQACNRGFGGPPPAPLSGPARGH
jgi:arylsulfatase A-like enzyme